MTTQKRDDEHGINGNDVVRQVVDFQRKGVGFDDVWAALHPIVVEIARRNLVTLGVRVSPRNDDGPVGEVVNETVKTLLGLSDSGARGRFEPRRMRSPGLSGLRAWLWKVVRSRAVDWVRRERGSRSVRITPEAGLHWNALPREGENGSILKRQIAKIDRADLLPILAESIRQLPNPEVRQAVSMQLMEGCSQRDVAKRLQVAAATMHRRLRTAYALIRRELEDRGIDGSWLPT